jgi:asparagine N-glycosylation enzyme membrane subunit Stt3
LAKRIRQTLEIDAGRDIPRTNVGLVILGVLCVLGVIQFIVFGGLPLLLGGGDAGSFLALGVSLLAIFLAGLMAIMIGSRNTTARILTGTLGGIVVGAGVAVLLIVAMCIDLLNTCARIGAAR